MLPNFVDDTVDNWKVSSWGPWVALNVQKAGHNSQLQLTVGPWGRTQLKITLHLFICWTQLSEGMDFCTFPRVHSLRQALFPLCPHHAPGLLSLKGMGDKLCHIVEMSNIWIIQDASSSQPVSFSRNENTNFVRFSLFSEMTYPDQAPDTVVCWG